MGFASFRTSLAPPLPAPRDHFSLLKTGDKEKVGLVVTMLARLSGRIHVLKKLFLLKSQILYLFFLATNSAQHSSQSLVHKEPSNNASLETARHDRAQTPGRATSVK